MKVITKSFGLLQNHSYKGYDKVEERSSEEAGFGNRAYIDVNMTSVRNVFLENLHSTLSPKKIADKTDSYYTRVFTESY